MIDFAAARLNMVEGQIRTNKVTEEAVLSAFLSVPRERFVPPALRGAAYVDEDLPLGPGRFLMQPMVLARLLQAARIARTDQVLELGSGTGYGSAILARLARQTIALESNAALAGEARQRLRELAIDNVQLYEAPLTEGYAGRAPYEVILFQGTVQRIPEAITRQLAEGGRLVAVLRAGAGVGQAILMARTAGVLSQRPLFDATVPALPEFDLEPSFVF
jgi:protein-L-isoaspartate(D-aspartate) O-methyltransferase